MVNPKCSYVPVAMKSTDPINPPTSLPNIIPKPINQNTSEPTEKSIMFFIMIFPAFLALVNPVSTIANPACMKKTNAAAIKTQIVSIAIL